MVYLFGYYAFFYELNCVFYEFILFPCRIITLLTGPIERKHSRENAQRWKKEMHSVSECVNCFCFIVYAFWADAQLSGKNL